MQCGPHRVPGAWWELALGGDLTGFFLRGYLDLMRLFFLLLVLGFSIGAPAAVRVAFFEYYDARGKIIEFEPGGRFGHVAIEYQGLWLHSYPHRPVEALPLARIGTPAVILVSDRDPSLTSAQVLPFLHLPYDLYFNWEDTNSTYCSKLIGKLLSLPPEPMTFVTEYWKGRENLPEGEPGLSPDDVYRDLILRNYKKLK